jgi:hypothetical protein
MIGFAIIYYLFGILFIALGMAIYKGKTRLVHYYHQKNVTDHAGFGKAMGKPLAFIGVSFIVSASLAFFGEIWLSVGIALSVVSIIAMVVICLVVIKKYNGRIFTF